MIARVWHGSTLQEHTEHYLEYLTETGVKNCLGTDGNLGVQILRKERLDRTDFTFISFWRSLDDITRFAGADVGTAVYYPRDRAFLLELTPTVEHYEVFEFPSGEGVRVGQKHAAAATGLR